MPKLARWKTPETHQKTKHISGAARLMGMARDTFDNLANAGFIRRNDEGEWDTRLLVEQLTAYQAQEGPKPKSDASRSPGLERLRELQGDKAEIELARTRGELVDRDSVYAAISQVVEIVKADLMALPGWGASELTSLGPEEIEKRLTRKAEAIALGFERKCGDVRLIPAVPKQEPEGKPKRVRKRK